MEYLPFFLFILIMALFIGYAVYAKTSRNRAWEALASSLGLSFTPAGLFFGSPRITGTYRGHSLTMETFTRAYGKSRQIYTRIYLSLNNQTDLSLRIRNENVIRKIGKMLGQEDIEIGNEEIDRRYVIQGTPEISVRSIFNSMKLQQDLQDLRSSMVVEVSNNSILFEKRGASEGEDHLRFLLDFLNDLADGIKRYG